jgi:hypothetical protein
MVTAPCTPTEPAVNPAPDASPRRSRPSPPPPPPPPPLLLLLLLAPTRRIAECPLSPKNSCLGLTCAPSPVMLLGEKACDAHSRIPDAAPRANITPSLPRKASVPLPSLTGGSMSFTPGSIA